MAKKIESSLGSRGFLSTGFLLAVILLSSCTADTDAEKQPVTDTQQTDAGAPLADTAAQAVASPDSALASPADFEPTASTVSRTTPSQLHQPTKNSYDLLNELQELAWDKEAINSKQTADLLDQLRLQGADALIPIRDFLMGDDSNKALPELRRALLDVLLHQGLPEVEGVALELLASQPSAMEAWQLGHYLESIQPGVYTPIIRSSAEQALIEAKSAEILPGEFFVFLGRMGNEETALLLSELPPHQEAYGSVALVFIPEGGGTPMLEQDARAFEAGRDTLQGRLALQLLALQAPQYPEAAAALIEIAEQGLIPHGLWPYVLDIVAGSWEITVSDPPSDDLIGSHTYFHADGNQLIYRVARHEDDVDDGLQEQRLYLLDRLQPFAPPDLVPVEGG